MFESIRRTVRSLARRRAFTVCSITLLALGVGAVNAISAIVSATFLRPLPYAAPNALVAVQIATAVTRDSSTMMPLAAMQLMRLREQSRQLAQLEGYTPTTFAITGTGEPMPLPGAVVSAGLFDLLGVHPILGHGFTRADEQPGSATALISYGLWQGRFGGRPDVLGSTLTIDGAPRAIVGIMPRDFTLAFQSGDAWVPMALGPNEIATTRLRMVFAIGRLHPGATPRQAAAELNGINTVLAQEFPEAFRGTRADVSPLRDALFGAQRGNLIVLSIAVLLVLLIATTNVVNLSLADVVHRRVATLTRLAFGASRSVIVRSRLTDALVISAVATALGLVVGRATLAALLATNPDAFVGAPVMDIRVIAISVVAGLLFGFLATLPAAFVEASLRITSIASAMSRSVGGVAERRAREFLIAGQMAITLLLLVGATLLARHARALLARSPGFDATSVVAVQLTIPTKTYPTSDARGVYVSRMLEAVRATPGVLAASTIQSRFILNQTTQTIIEVEGKPSAPGVQEVTNVRNVMADLFQTLRITVREGRGIDATDRADARPVAVVSTTFARKYWGKESPVGKRIRRTNRADAPWLDIVGVVDDIEDQGAGVSPGPMLYLPYLQQNTPTVQVTVVARVRGAPSPMITPIRAAIWSVDRGQVIEETSPLQALLVRSVAAPRFQALVVTLFGSVAFVLVLGGVYALTLFSVLRRTRELGVRAALGALPAELLRLSMWQGVRPMLAGLLIGTLGAVFLVWEAPQLLQQPLGSADVEALVGVWLAVLASGCLAAFIPALRAVRISPATAFRQ